MLLWRRFCGRVSIDGWWFRGIVLLWVVSRPFGFVPDGFWACFGVCWRVWVFRVFAWAGIAGVAGWGVFSCVGLV